MKCFTKYLDTSDEGGEHAGDTEESVSSESDPWALPIPRAGLVHWEMLLFDWSIVT